MANANGAFIAPSEQNDNAKTNASVTVMVSKSPITFSTMTERLDALELEETGATAATANSGSVSKTAYDNVLVAESSSQRTDTSNTLPTERPNAMPNIPPDITKASQSNPAKQSPVKRIISKISPSSSLKNSPTAAPESKNNQDKNSHIYFSKATSNGASSSIKISVPGPTADAVPAQKAQPSNTSAVKVGHHGDPIGYVDDGAIDVIDDHVDQDQDHLSPILDRDDPKKMSRRERFVHQKLLPRISKRLPKLPEEFAPNMDNHHMAKFAKITEARVVETQKQRRMTMEMCKTAAHAARCCGAAKACIHHNDCLNVAESMGGRLVFDKIGDLLKSKEINLDMARCDFGHAMRDRHFAHLRGTMFNSSSYGCTPDVVTQARQALEVEMQANNVLWRFKTVPIRVRQTEYALAQVLHTDPDDLVLVPNANYATNAVFKSQPWEFGDRLMVFSCDYDATMHACEYLRWTYGVIIEIVDMPLPASQRAILRRVRSALESLKFHKKLPVLANFCHVTSKSGTIFPARKLVKLFHDFGVSVMVDGAQAAGQIPLNLSQIGADYYAGTMHKWMYSAPAVGFLVVDPTKQDLIEPLVVSYFYGSNFTKSFSYTGHMDFTGYITAHYALDFINDVCGGLRKTQKYLRGLAKKVVQHLTHKWGTRCCQKYPNSYGSMPIIELPMGELTNPSPLHAGALMLAMLEQYEMTVFIYVEEFFGTKMMVIRLAVQIFHELSDFQKLGDAILALRPAQFLEDRLDDVKSFLTQPFT